MTHTPTVVRDSDDLIIANVESEAHGTVQVRWANTHDTSPVMVAVLVDGEPTIPPVGPLRRNWPTPEVAMAWLGADKVSALDLSTSIRLEVDYRADGVHVRLYDEVEDTERRMTLTPEQFRTIAALATFEK